jgi:ribosome-binding factor A
MAREFSRNQRLGNQVLRTLNEFLTTEVKDPRLKMVSLNAINLSRDLSIARIHFITLDQNISSVIVKNGLDKASGFLRRRLSQEIKIRHAPELRFFHDNSAAEAQHISNLIDAALESDLEKNI